MGHLKSHLIRKNFTLKLQIRLNLRKFKALLIEKFPKKDKKKCNQRCMKSLIDLIQAFRTTLMPSEIPDITKICLLTYFDAFTIRIS